MQGCELQRLLLCLRKRRSLTQCPATGLATVDLRTLAGELGVQPDASAGVLAGQ